MTSTKNITSSKDHSQRYRKIFLFCMIFCALGFIISLGLFIQKISDVRHEWSFHPHNPMGIIFSGSRYEKTLSGEITVDDIEPWMTFAYINFRFHLPPEYLKNQLQLEEKKYPEIPLSRYAKKNNIETPVFVSQVKNAIRNISLTSSWSQTLE